MITLFLALCFPTALFASITYNSDFDDYENEIVVAVSSDARAPERAQGIARTWARRFRDVLFFVDTGVNEIQSLRAAVHPYLVVVVNRTDGDRLQRPERSSSLRVSMKGFSLTIFHRLFGLRPNAQWFFHADDDTFVVPINVLMSIRQYDWQSQAYLGKLSAAHGVREPGTFHTRMGASMPFVIGGGGILLSRGLLAAAAPHLPNCSSTYRYTTPTSDSHLARCLLQSIDSNVSARATEAFLTGVAEDATREYSKAFSRLHAGIALPGVNNLGIRRVLAAREMFSAEKRAQLDESLVLTVHPLCQSEMISAWAAVTDAMRTGSAVTWGAIHASWHWTGLSATEVLHREQNLSFCFSPLPSVNLTSYWTSPSLRDRTSVLRRALLALPASAARSRGVLSVPSTSQCVHGRFTSAVPPVRHVLHCLRMCAMLLFDFAGLSDGSWCRCAHSSELNQLLQADPRKCNQRCTLESTVFCGGRNVTSVYSVESALAIQTESTHRQ